MKTIGGNLTIDAMKAMRASAEAGELLSFDAKTWPRDPANGRLLCAPTHPMPKGAPGQWAHTNRISNGGTSDYYDDYRCTDCGCTWSEELPE